MVSSKEAPPGPSRPKTTTSIPESPPSALPFSPRPSPPNVASPSPLRPIGPTSWASSLSAGLFPTASSLFPLPPVVPQGLQPISEAVQSAGGLPKPHTPLSLPLLNNALITDLASAFPAPSPSDPWHRAHACICAHATAACAACSISISCCSCCSLCFTPGPPPVSPSAPQDRHSRSASPALFQLDERYAPSRPASRALFRSDVGNGPSPFPSHSHDNNYDDINDDAYAQALADADTCDNSSCPNGLDAPARYSIIVEAFDESNEEFYDRTYRACAVCNRSCKKSFLGNRIKSRVFDNSVKDKVLSKNSSVSKIKTGPPLPTCRAGPVPGSAPYAHEHPTDDAPVAGPSGPPTKAVLALDEQLQQTHPHPHITADPVEPSALLSSNPPLSPIPSGLTSDRPSHQPLDIITALQDSLHELNHRPSTPAAFVASIRVKHDALCSHPVDSCTTCSLGLLCCACHHTFAPAVARHLACTNCKHIAFTCCVTALCCKCSKIWAPSDSINPDRLPARRFYGGAGSHSTSSPEPDIWTPSPRSSPDEIDDLTARANVPLPVSRSESDASRVPSRASSVDEPVNVAATPLPTLDYSSIADELIDGFTHASFPDRALLDAKDKHHFLGRGDLSVTSLKLYTCRIFTDSTHWITVGHFLVDVFLGSTINGTHDDFRRFVILVGTQLGFGDLAQSMSESIDVNRKMADKYMRLRDIATTWKQKAKGNSKDAKDGRKARDELEKAKGDIAIILEERDVFITQRNELLANVDQLNLELATVHCDYGNAIDDNTQFAANIDALQKAVSAAKNQLQESKNQLTMAEHHRNKAEFDCEQPVFTRDKAIADQARDKAFYEARIIALSSPPVPTSQPDTETSIKAADAERTVLLTRIENLKKELSVHDAERVLYSPMGAWLVMA